jgi:S1-C subfamily serine protease
MVLACVAGGGVLVASLLLFSVLWTGRDRQVAEPAATGTQSPATTPAASPAGTEPGTTSSSPLPGTAVLPAASPPTDQGGLKPGETDLCYRWKEGEQYAYRISCKAEVGNLLLETTGTNAYTVGRSPGLGPNNVDPSQAAKGSGTAFVVSSDGYLVTCAHVVRGATDIQVTLGGQTTPCDVVARDDAHDLALLRTARQKLPVLPLGDSEAVELAEEVRAIGFPLSDVLGSSLKVTQGSVAGIAVQRRGKVFQIDAAVNPGNSGGPLVDGRGSVVGVVNAQLVGFDVSKVGFAVPVNYAKTLLGQHRVAFQAAAAGPKLDGPTLAKRVAPSVGLVTMTCHGGDSAGQQRVALDYHAVLETHKQNRQASGDSGFRQAEPAERDDGKLVVDEYGEIFDSHGQVNLPFLLGPVASVVIDPISADGGKTWHRQETLMLTSTKGHSAIPFAGLRPPGFHGPRFRHGPPFSPFGFGPFSEPEPPSSYPAIQQTIYTMEEPQGTTVLVRKRLELKTLEKVGAGPKIELTGNGETLFDLKAGVPRKVTFSGTFTIRENGDTTQVPLTLACERIAGGTLPQAPPAASAPVVTAPAPPPPPESAESAKARLDRLLEVLRSPDRDWGKCFESLQGLAMMQPIDTRRDEVAEVLDKYLAEKNYSARSSALRAVQTWGTKRNVPALIGLLKPSETDSVHGRAMEILGRLGDERAVPAIAESIKNPADRAAAARALRAFGRAAETAAIALVANEDPEVRVEACNVLGEIGGPKSAAALKEQLQKDTNAEFKSAAKRALEKVQKRP